MQTTAIGNRGEQTATEQLVRDGYRILSRNWKTKFCEIDIIAIKDNVVYFVEVKFRRTNRQGDGFDYITPQKLRHMYRAAELWVVMHGWHGEYALLAASVSGANDSIEILEIA